jgi:ABC-type lipoprotein release transport system permease subunit
VKWIVVGLLTGAALGLWKTVQIYRIKRQFEAMSWNQQVQAWKD